MKSSLRPVYIIVPVFVDTILYRVVATSWTSVDLNFGKEGTNYLLILNIELWTLPKEINNMEVHASLPCAEVVKAQLYEESGNRFQQYLQEVADTPLCPNYLIPPWNNHNKFNTNDNTDLILFKSCPFESVPHYHRSRIQTCSRHLSSVPWCAAQSAVVAAVHGSF